MISKTTIALVIVVLVSSCSSEKEHKLRDIFPEVVQAHGYKVPEDSMEKPKVTPVGKPTIIPIGKPKVVPTNTTATSTEPEMAIFIFQDTFYPVITKAFFCSKMCKGFAIIFGHPR